jgi:hypothetical protein
VSRENVQEKNVGRTLLSVAFDFGFDCLGVLSRNGAILARGFRSRSKATDRSVRPSKAVRRASFAKRDWDFNFPCRESKPQWTYARGIPPFATNAKNGPPGNVTKNVRREKCGTDTPVRRL